jgi:hypothetical protein
MPIIIMRLHKYHPISLETIKMKVIMEPKKAGKILFWSCVSSAAENMVKFMKRNYLSAYVGLGV